MRIVFWSLNKERDQAIFDFKREIMIKGGAGLLHDFYEYLQRLNNIHNIHNIHLDDDVSTFAYLMSVISPFSINLFNSKGQLYSR